MEKSVLEMIGGEKHINPHYDIKAESTSCYHSSEGFTGIEINGVRFSNIQEMLIYMNKQRDQLTKAREVIKNIIRVTWGEGWNYSLDWKGKAEQFLRETDIDNAIQQANEGLDLDKIAEEVEQDIKEQSEEVTIASVWEKRDEVPSELKISEVYYKENKEIEK